MTSTTPARPTRSRTVSGFARLWTASAASNLADGVLWVVVPLLATALTRSPALVAGVTLAQRLPWLLFALPAGALADRLDRRRTMFNVELLRVVVIGALTAATITGTASIWLLYAGAIVLGVGETLYDTAAQSAITAIVPKDELAKANGRLYAAEMTANTLVGPPLGGLLAGITVAGAVWAGYAIGLGASALLFGLAAGLIALLTGSFKPERSGGRTSMRADVMEGLRYLGGHSVLRTLAIMTGVQNLAFSSFMSVFVLYAVGPGSAMGLPTSAYGLLMTAMGIGGVVGSLATERALRYVSRGTVLGISLFAGALFVGVPALTAGVVPITTGFLIGSVTIVSWNVVTVSLRQSITPDHLLGRVNAGYRLLAWGSMPLGAALGGFLGEQFGLRATFAVSAAITLSLLPLLRLVTTAKLEAAEAAEAA
jgi:MFS family permease